MLSNSEKESTSLPPPSALFGMNYYYPASSGVMTETRSGYMLPPPSSLPGYHLPPPPQYLYHPPPPLPSSQGTHEPTHNTNDTYNSNIYYYSQPTSKPSISKPLKATTATKENIVESKDEKATTKRKRRQNNTINSDLSLKKKKTTAPYHFEVLELKQQQQQQQQQYPKKSSKKQQKKDSEAASAAAATLASFASVSPSVEEEEEEEDSVHDECIHLEACAGKDGQFECDSCGSNYRHLNCLQRHGWEHTKIRSSMTKQQQTQLLEAAQILMDIARYGMKMRMLH